MKAIKLVAAAALLQAGFSAHAVSVSKAAVDTGAIHAGGNDVNERTYYASGNDDAFGEYGIASFEFNSSEFGGPITSVSSVVLSLTHNDRFFSDGDEVEFFFTAQAFDANYSGLTYNGALFNGIDASQYSSAPISLGTFAYAPDAGGVVDDFSLEELNQGGSSAQSLIDAINGGLEFQIIIGVTDAATDATYSGVGNTFDPGDPTLAIEAAPVPVPAAFSLLGSALVALRAGRRRKIR